MENFDVIVIGAGPAGYVAAIRCAQLGLKTACVDEWKNDQGKASLGGTCLNAGCIPSKALLESSEHYYQLRHEIADHGIKLSSLSLDLKQMMQRKNDIVRQLTQGIRQLFKANGVQFFSGHGLLKADKIVQVQASKKRLLRGENIILASGSKPMQIPVARTDQKFIVDSSAALNFDKVPQCLAIIGAGVIGLELGSVWKRLGSEVILLEAQEKFLPVADEKIASLALKAYKKSGLDIRLAARVSATEIITRNRKKQVQITYVQNNQQKQIVVDKVLVAVGRVPNTSQLFDHDVDLLMDESGHIHVDGYCRTNLPGVYAIGDVVRGPMLAHKGSEEAMAVAETIAGIQSTVELDRIPSVIYTLPEIAWVGKNEQMLKAEAIAYKSGIFPYAANGRALAMKAMTGQVKILSDKQSDQILGVHILGVNASELIAQAVIAMEFESTAEDLARTVFAHPTLSEAMHEAALAVDKRAIHKINT